MPPMMNRENIIQHINLAYSKLSKDKENDLESMRSQEADDELWFDFFNYCLDLASANIVYLLKYMNNRVRIW